MPGDMFGDEARDEEVGMVVAVLQAQCQLLSRFGASLFEKFGFQLFGEKLVREPLVDENVVEITT